MYPRHHDTQGCRGRQRRMQSSWGDSHKRAGAGAFAAIGAGDCALLLSPVALQIRDDELVCSKRQHTRLDNDFNQGAGIAGRRM
jgi:hypothetical protein